MLRFENVSKSYSSHRFASGKTIALDNVSFTIKSGQVFGLIGPSGSGKSTIGRLALGLETPDSGTICFLNRPLSAQIKVDGPHYRQRCQAIFQDPKASLSPRLTIQELLFEPLRLMAEIPENEYGTILSEWFDKVKLSKSVLDHKPHEISGGEAQRICIIRSLIRNPQLLICDEPTSNLDVATEWDIVNLIHNLQEKYDLTVLFMTHNLYLLPALADVIGIMHKGQMIETGTVNQVFQHPEHEMTRSLVRNTLLKKAI